MQLSILNFKRSYLKLINAIKTINEDSELKFHVYFFYLFIVTNYLNYKKISLINIEHFYNI